MRSFKRSLTSRQEGFYKAKQFHIPLDEISGAVRRPYSRFPVAYGQGLDSELPHLTPLGKLVTLFVLRAYAELDAGQTDQALADVETVFRIENSIKDEPLAVSQLVRITMLAQVQPVVWEGLEAHRWTDAQIVILQKDLANTNLPEGMQLSFRGERASFNVSVAQMTVRTENGENEGAKLKRIVPNGIFRHMQLNVNLYYDRYLFNAVDLPGRRIRKDVIIAGEERLAQMRPNYFLGLPVFNPYNILTLIWAPVYSSVAVKFACEQSMTDLALVACALERYRLANGRFPGSLAQLVPKYLNAIPPDVVRGEQPIYRLNADGTYLLYEKGWNGNDNGGKVIEKPDGKGIDTKKSDWVWSPKPL